MGVNPASVISRSISPVVVRQDYSIFPGELAGAAA